MAQPLALVGKVQCYEQQAWYPIACQSSMLPKEHPGQLACSQVAKVEETIRESKVYLVNDTIPGEPGIVDNDMNLTTPELGRTLD